MEFSIIFNFRLLRPADGQQSDALLAAMSEILWHVGEKAKVTVVLPGETPHISHSHTYFQDSVTERLFLFHFNDLEDLQIFLKRYLYFVSIFF